MHIQLFLNWTNHTGFKPRQGNQSTYTELASFINSKRDGGRLHLPENESILPSLSREIVSSFPLSLIDVQSAYKNGAVGIGEETGDVLFFVFLNTALQTNVITKERIDKFILQNKNLMNPKNERNFETLKSHAYESITNDDIEKIGVYLPDSHYGKEKKDAITKNMLTVFILSGLIFSYKFPNCNNLNLLDEGLCERAIPNELRELSKKTKQKYINNFLDLTRQQFNIKYLCRSSSFHINRVANFDFTLFTTFEIEKCMSRLELFYHSNGGSYKDYSKLKTTAKGWEKLLEIRTFND